MGFFVKIKRVVCWIIGKCSNCGDTLTMSNRHKPLCISCEWAQDKNSNNKEIFKMQTNDGGYLDLLYLGHSRYSPNYSASGYGSDDWMYLCKENDIYYLLMFSDSAEYGTGWMCTELLEEDFEDLVKKDANYWRSVAHSNERTKTYTIRLTDVESVRHLLPTNSRCCSKLTDEHYLR